MSNRKILKFKHCASWIFTNAKEFLWELSGTFEKSFCKMWKTKFFSLNQLSRNFWNKIVGVKFHDLQCGNYGILLAQFFSQIFRQINVLLKLEKNKSRRNTHSRNSCYFRNFVMSSKFGPFLMLLTRIDLAQSDR